MENNFENENVESTVSNNSDSEKTNELETTTTSTSSEETNPFDFNVEASSNNSDKGKSGNYNATALLAFFLGNLGIHRMINGKKKSGIIMLVLGIFASLPFVTLFAIKKDEIADGDTLTTILLIVFAVLIAIVPLWKTIDLIVIMVGKFKNGKTKEYVKSGKSFFKTWSNILIIILVVLSMISGSLLFALGVFSSDDSDPEVTNVKGGDDDEDKRKVEGDLGDYLDSITDCIYSGDSFDVEDLDEFQDTLEEYYEQFDYELDLYESDDNDGTIYFEKEEDGIDYEITLRYSEKNNGKYNIKSCEFYAVYYEYADDDIYVSVSYDSYFEELGVYASIEFEGEEEITVFGDYIVEDDEYELNAYLESESDDYWDSDSDTDFSYDVDEDEYGIMEFIDVVVSAYLDEEEAIFG